MRMSCVCTAHVVCVCEWGHIMLYPRHSVCARARACARANGTSDRGPTPGHVSGRVLVGRGLAERVSTRPSVRSEYISHMRPHCTPTLSHGPFKSVSTDSASVNSKARQGNVNSRWVIDTHPQPAKPLFSSHQNIRKAGESQSAECKAKQEAVLEVVQWRYPAQ
jgi:hypothetical protein